MSNDTDRAAAYTAGYRAGFEQAVQDMEAGSIHWEQFGVKPLVLQAVRDSVAAVRSGWYCASPSHTHPACLARKDGAARRTVATEPGEVTE